MGKQGGREERKGATRFGKVLGLVRPGIGKSDSTRFGRREKAREEEETDARDPVVSEEKGREGARAGWLTGVCADGWGKERKGKLPERVSFLFFF